MAKRKRYKVMVCLVEANSRIETDIKTQKEVKSWVCSKEYFLNVAKEIYKDTILLVKIYWNYLNML